MSMKINTMSLKNRAGNYIKNRAYVEDRLLSKIIPLDVPNYERNSKNGIKTRKSNGDVIQITVR